MTRCLRCTTRYAVRTVRTARPRLVRVRRTYSSASPGQAALSHRYVQYAGGWYAYSTVRRPGTHVSTQGPHRSVGSSLADHLQRCKGCRGVCCGACRGVEKRRCGAGPLRMCRRETLTLTLTLTPTPTPTPPPKAMSPFDGEPALVLVAACKATLWPEGRDRDLVGVRVRFGVGVGVRVRS